MRTCGAAAATAFDPKSMRAVARERSHVPRNSRGQPMAKKMQSMTDRPPPVGQDRFRHVIVELRPKT